MMGSSGVDKRKGMDANDCGYGRRNSLYSNGGRAGGRTCGAGVAASAVARAGELRAVATELESENKKGEKVAELTAVM